MKKRRVFKFVFDNFYPKNLFSTNLAKTTLTFFLSILANINNVRGVRGGAAPPPSTLAPPERLRGGTHEGGSFNITSACISLPQARHSGVPRGQ